MKILLGIILKLDFDSISRGRCTETLLATGHDPAYIIHAIHQRLMVGHQLKRNQSGNMLNLKDQQDDYEISAVVSNIEILPLLECQIHPLYSSFKNVIYVLNDNTEFKASTYKKISGFGFYQPMIEQLENLQKELSTDPKWQALAS